MTIGQSKTIDRFIAKRCGFMGASDVEAAQADMVGEHCSDIKKVFEDRPLSLTKEIIVILRVIRFDCTRNLLPI